MPLAGFLGEAHNLLSQAAGRLDLAKLEEALGQKGLRAAQEQRRPELRGDGDALLEDLSAPRGIARHGVGPPFVDFQGVDAEAIAHFFGNTSSHPRKSSMAAAHSPRLDRTCPRK